MSPQKIILHRLDSPDIWEWEQSERSHSRRKILNVSAAIASVCVMTAMFQRQDTVEDYSLNSASRPAIETRQTPGDSESIALSYLADSRGK